MARPLVRDEEGVSTLVSLIGVLLLVIAILAVYFGFLVPKFAGPPLRARSGDDVLVDYVGRFENGLVFDTSLVSVAGDNSSNPKAFAFGWHPPWQPLEVKSVGSGEVVKGFDLGIQGLAVGDATTIAVPPDLGYGAADPTKVFVKPNKYEQGRALVVVYNWGSQGSVNVNLSNVLRSGQRYEVRNVQNMFGAAVASGTFNGGSISVPMNGVNPPARLGRSTPTPPKTGPNFDTFVVVPVS